MRYLLKYVSPIFFSFLLLTMLLGFIWAIKNDQKPLPCRQQIPEEKMEELGRKGVKEVNFYLNHIGGCDECYEMRIRLIKTLEKKRLLSNKLNK